MVSFQCENCGDVLTKKKTDPHRNQCRGAYFSCLDCQTTFPGNSYRTHTQCISEAQKYQGALYKEKPEKPKKSKSVTINETPSYKPAVHRDPWVEDAPDIDDVRPNNNASAPPPAPSPPPATPRLESGKDSAPAAKSDALVNVFDYLVPADTPNASKVSLGGSNEPMTMVKHAPPLFNAPKELAKLDNGKDDEVNYDLAFEENGFSYGADTLEAPLYKNDVAAESTASINFVTPAPKRTKDRSRKDHAASPDNTSTNNLTGTGDKKRKRGHIEEINSEFANTAYGEDAQMTDAPPSSVVANPSTPALNHSGLTGGLNRMMRDYSPTPDQDNGSGDEHGNGRRYKDPVSPIKRSRRADKETNGTSHNENGLGIAIKGRAGRIMSILGGGGINGVTTVNGSSNDPASRALVRTRRRSSSDGVEASNSRAVVPVRRQKKRHRVVQVDRHSRKRHANGYDEDTPRRLKAIEYNPGSDSENRSRSPNGTRGLGKSSKSANAENQLVVYGNGADDDDNHDMVQRERASVFLSLVTKGPDSERGCSMHKTLRRYRRECPSEVGSQEKDKERERGRGRRRGREGRGDEDKELWKVLRLKRNDRGEVVVFV
ncbi:hypothetical protein AJ79_07232 [Helicocarpus griseus UAMH5409]|uniref:Zinc finger C2H2 LYAR-type domain-containing protein n=1 Tax=Helicocarpus griseus UAMH5409 TaxID=1447875 RepID=A0A2B7X532_9EURO|nr:hypothetical protein AJ79_07232 [Helicocarpus griseus UAMH5409]